MKVLYFSQFYTPESIAPSFRATENSKIWADMGNDITVFTGYPNYPTGKIFDGYNPVLLSEEIINNVRVLRSKLVAKPNTSIIKRLENALSYFFFGLVNIVGNNRKIGKDYDVVLGTSGVIFNAWLAEIYARLLHLPFVFEIRDITYVQMKATGKSSHSLTVLGMKWLEMHLCKKAKKVVVVTNGFKKTLIEDGIPEAKIEVITNGVDVQECKDAYNLEKKFIMSYFGTLGISQNICDTFEYGETISSVIAEFEYLIIGEGAQKDEIQRKVESTGSSFIKMLPGMKSEELEPYYNDTQLSIVTLKKSDNFKYTLPSKLFQIMGRGIAVLFIGPDGEAAEIIRKYHTGIALTGTKEQDIQILKDFFMKNNWREELKKMGSNGRIAVEKNYSRRKLAEDYISILQDCVD